MHVTRAIFLLFLVTSCHSKSAITPKPAGHDKVLARVDGKAITISDLESFIASQPAQLRSRYATPEAKKDLLRYLVRFELMANEADKKGYAARPEIRRGLKQQMVSLLLEEEVTQSNEVSDADVKAYLREQGKELGKDDEHNAVKPSQAKLDSDIRSRIVAERRGKSMERWLTNLRAHAKVETFEENLAAAHLDPAQVPSLATRDSR